MQVLAIPRSSIGKKAIMAVTGLVWIGFLAAHMWGNLHIFQGADSFNHYAEFLREVGYPIFSHAQLLWLLRIVTVTALALHIWAAWSLYRLARQAHGSNYAMKRVVQANYATRFMRIGGVVIILFVLFHLAQFTWVALPETALTPRIDFPVFTEATLNGKVPQWPHRTGLGPDALRDEAGQPDQPAPLQDHHRRLRAGGRCGGGDAG
jgi:hypothetical protein